jgi:hypothetical protein
MSCDSCAGETNRETFEPYCYSCADKIHEQYN